MAYPVSGSLLAAVVHYLAGKKAKRNAPYFWLGRDAEQE